MQLLGVGPRSEQAGALVLLLHARPSPLHASTLILIPCNRTVHFCVCMRGARGRDVYLSPCKCMRDHTSLGMKACRERVVWVRFWLALHQRVHDPLNPLKANIGP
eukprot:1150255-Pelagomonas_calceolata.AAC.6